MTIKGNKNGPAKETLPLLIEKVCTKNVVSFYFVALVVLL
jgi:hypothetical protein